MQTEPCPADQAAPLEKRSLLADLALRAGIAADDVRAYLAARAREHDAARLLEMLASV